MMLKSKFSLILFLALMAVILVVPSAFANVSDYSISSLVLTGPNTLEATVEGIYCSGCNANYSGNPGCTPFENYTGPGYAGCNHLTDGRYIAVRLLDSSNAIVGEEKLVLDPYNWPLTVLGSGTLTFTLPNITVNQTYTARADLYCSYCGHWYSDDVSVDVVPPVNHYILSYDGNGADSGTPPATAPYEENESVTTAGNTDFVKAGFDFDGWKDVNGNIYVPGTTFSMPANDLVLYAIWKPQNEAPDCANATASQSTLWPPNNKYVDIDIIGVTDVDADDVVTIMIESVTSDEPTVTKEGAGGKVHAPDAVIVDGDTVQLCAERSGTSDGRVYIIEFTATDLAGATCSGSIAVSVPHDELNTADDSRGTGDVPDDGYNATVEN